MANRRKIPAEIEKEVLLESGHRCAVCGAFYSLRLGHITPWRQSKEYKAEDLIYLCANCHERAHSENWDEEVLGEYKRRPWVMRQYNERDSIPKTTAKVTLQMQIEMLLRLAGEYQRILPYEIAALFHVSPLDVRVISIEEDIAEFGEDFLNSQEAKEQASEFVQRRAGRCLAVRKPILEETDTPVWLVPVITNVDKREAAFVGQIVLNARTGEVLNEERDVVEMVKKGHQSLGFHRFPLRKRERLAELLAENQERDLTEGEQKEMRDLLAEEQSLQIRNLEEMEKRLLKRER